MTQTGPNLETQSKVITRPNTREAESFSGRLFLFVLAAALFACFPKVVLGIETFFYRDFGAQVYPALYYLRESLLGGKLPLWNPYNHCGEPFMAQWGYWYPGNLIMVLLPMPWSANLFLLLHMFFGGCGMYWLCRKLGTGPFAASFAGMAYIFNGVTLSCLMWTSYTAALSWLPWVLGLTMAAWRNGGRTIALAALAAGLQVLTGTPEITLLFWMFLGLVWLAEVLSRDTPFGKSFLRLSAVVALAAGMTMVQMLPFLDLLAHSQRDRNYGGTAWAMPGWGWANLLVPLFHCYQAPQGPWFQPGQDLINSYYLGAGVLLLALAAVWQGRGRLQLCLAGTAVFCWIMALGPNGVMYDFVKRVCPLMGVVRFPVKFAMLPGFLMPLLAMGAVQKILDRENADRRILVILATVFLALMAGLLWFAHQYPFPYDNWAATARNCGWRAVVMLGLLGGLICLPLVKQANARRVIQIILLGILPLDALTHSPRMVPSAPVSLLQGNFWSASGNPPAPKLGEGRIMIHPEAEQKLFYSLIRDLGLDFTSKRLGEWYNLNLLDNLPKVTGASVLRPGHFDMIERYAYYTSNSHVGQGLLDFLSVASISSPDEPVRWSMRTNYLPFITGGQRPEFMSDDRALNAICADNFDPRRTVYLPESERARLSVERNTECRVSEIRFAEQRIEMTVTASETSLVVMSQSFYHLWRGFIDGQPGRLVRANLAFTAIEVPAGTHRIKLTYNDPNLGAGAIISLGSLAGCGLVWRRKDRQKL